MIRFGAAGNSQSFYAEGYNHTFQAPAWLKERGLNAFEYSFGRGINIKPETAEKIASQMRANDIAVSCHAPYYINFASTNEESVVKSIDYIERSIKAINQMGGNRCIVHSGTQGKENTRADAIKRIYVGFELLLNHLEGKGYDYIICPETMGRYSQIGNYQEIIDLCKISKYLIPCLDFGHINCLMQGGLKTYDDYKKIIDYALDALGERAKYLHIHFSKIKFGEKGEICHLNFEEEGFGPYFEPLAKLISDYKLEPIVISESAGKMAEDAIVMRDAFLSYQRG